MPLISRLKILWEGEKEGRTLSLCALGPEPAAVALYYSVNCRKPDAETFEFAIGLEPLKGTEESVCMRHVETRTVITYEIAGFSGIVGHAEFDQRFRHPASILMGIARQVSKHHTQKLKLF
jgi:hypothetical protein